jgi:hypothetical protein
LFSGHMPDVWAFRRLNVAPRWILGQFRSTDSKACVAQLLGTIYKIKQMSCNFNMYTFWHLKNSSSSKVLTQLVASYVNSTWFKFNLDISVIYGHRAFCIIENSCDWQETSITQTSAFCLHSSEWQYLSFYLCHTDLWLYQASFK